MSLRLLFFALLLVAACDDGSRAVDPVWGKQACAHCAMLVSDPRFGAELTTREGDRLFFDDPGCMASYLRERSPHVRRMWVHDASGAWVDATQAHFRTGASSPMDFGFQADAAGSADWSAVVAAAAKRASEGGVM
ncbi:MAG TPA: hypothetical protein VLM85_29505 [Polyangiaceae bacterium]|nr:hypothetical protein [Polyangiaceae bacterium]